MCVIFQKNKGSEEIQGKELQELYMNITVSPFKEYSKNKGNSKEEKLIWDETDKETGENPLDRLCQLLRIDEEESKEKRYVLECSLTAGIDRSQIL